jgi:glutaredoxin 3
MKNVEIYTGPLCAFCDWTKALLKKKESLLKKSISVTTPIKCTEMVKKSNGMKTVPQIFIDGKHIGGNQELQALEKEGKLNSLLGI